jgi:hypothetical protein
MALMLYKRFGYQTNSVGLKYYVYNKENGIIDSYEKHFNVTNDRFELLKWLSLAMFTESKSKNETEPWYYEAAEYFIKQDKEYGFCDILEFLLDPKARIEWTVEAFQMDKDTAHPIKRSCISINEISTRSYISSMYI